MAEEDIKMVADVWKGQAHTAINSGYASAINHYTAQKNAFLRQLNLTTNESIEAFFNDLQETIAEELSNDDEILEAFDKGFDAIANILEAGIAEKIENGTNSNFDALEASLISKRPKEGSQYIEYDTAKKKLTSYLEKDFGANRQDYLSVFNQATGFYTTDGAAADFVFGQARKIIYNKATTGNAGAISRQAKHILKGYYKETIATNALLKVLQKYNKDLTAIQTGNVKNEKGESIIYDILIGSIKQLTGKTNDELYQFSEQLDSIGLNGSDLVSEKVDFIGAGGQSKSWVAPWDTKVGRTPNLYNLEIAHRADLKPTGEDAYYWHAGVYNAMSNMASVIGLQQTLFFTGAKPYFTADLLSQFKQENYVLAFAMDKDKDNLGYKWKIIKNAIYFRLHKD